MTARLIALVALASSLAGCLTVERSATADQRAAASALLAASEQCVYDVRDRQLKYDTAPNCTALRALSKRYIDVGGGTDSAPRETELMFAEARVHAWMARALSETEGPRAAVSIW